ncbi:MAG TPA: LamG-like jellyroll fold domain-containing protein [Verrucomicrobiae bacterium]|jgi:arabinan endo-1,5-alpha-L-arabinosidase|nr:LamG-like jellyroll fold domain-containing protein [Verrucomicrobiae bacterium]
MRFLLLLALLAGGSAEAGVNLRGYLDTHDPSTLINCHGVYYQFYTGQGIPTRSSTDKIFWNPGPSVFAHAPAWTTNAAPGFDGTIWAPDVFFWNGRYYLYYAISSFGSQVSAIGLATNPTLDPSDSAYHWTDQGPVIQSGNGSPYNTIDPSFCWDETGRLWMSFGSYWTGIYLTELDPVTGLRVAPNSPTYHLAYNSSIEASYVFRRGGYYYLFVNWGSCCSGVNSTYNIRVGRATVITGPYYDAQGRDMASGGGSLFLEGSGKYTGPGHVGILRENGVDWLTYHYYDAGAWSPAYQAFGVSKFDLMPLSWTADNWPVAPHDWSAIHNFAHDARDDNNQYYGLLLNGASTHDGVLHLNGVNQYAQLPAGEAFARSYEAVVNWNGGAPWQRIFDFGVDTNHWLFLTPSDGQAMQFAITDDRNSRVQTIEAPAKLPSNTWVNVAVTLDGTNGILYLNGAPAAVSAISLSPLDVRAQTNYLGRSQWPADPYFAGQIASFRSFAKVLSPSEITAPQPIISAPATFSPGAALSFSGSARDFMAQPIATSGLSWTVTLARDGVTNVVFGPSNGVAGGSFSVPTTVNYGTYAVTLTATDASGRSNTASAFIAAAHPPSQLSSYYSFRADATDANRRLDGVLHGGGSIQSDPTRGNVLSLSGNGQYVSLPPGASDFKTFMAWVKWNGGAAWQRIFDFGDDTNRYTVLTPMAANGKFRHNISIASIPGEEINDAGGPLPVGVWTHVAVVMDGQTGTLYSNGIPVATNLFMDLTPADVGGTNNYFGKSNWPDPYFNGELSSVRLFTTAFTAAQITAPIGSISQPISGATYTPGQVIPFAGTASDFNDTSLAATSLTWVIEYHNGASTTVVDTRHGIASGLFSQVTAATGFYRFNLVATDGQGRASTNYADVFPSAAAANWQSFYPFDSSANDSSDLNNGVLKNGASIVADPARGNVMNLSGFSQYAALPAGVGGFETFSGGVYWRGGAAWQRIFDFGNDTAHWAFLTPQDASGNAQCSITSAGGTFVQSIEAPGPLPLNAWTQVGVVFDGRQGILYFNGRAVAVNNSVNLLPSDIAPTNCWLGRSQYPSDPYFRGEMDGVFLSSAVAPFSALLGPIPPDISFGVTNATLTLSWPAWDAEFSLYTATNLNAWSYVTQGVTSVQFPLKDTARFFQLRE